jgi:hypothetical protein
VGSKSGNGLSKDEGETILFYVLMAVVTIILFGMGKFALDTTAERKAQPNWTWHRICKNNDKRAEFIINCAKAANPMSDEEGEDLVEQCQRTSYDLFCEQIKEYY